MQCKWLRGLSIAALCLSGTLQAGVIENAFGWWKGEKQTPPAINVLIVHDQPGVILEVKGKYKLYDPHTNNFYSTRFIGKRKFVQALPDGLKWGEEFPGVHQIKVVPDDDKTTSVVDGVEYKGNIIVYDIGGSISVVNEVPVDEYLKSILMPQFDTKMPKEAAAAVAIVARTQAWNQATKTDNTYWSVEATRVGYEGTTAKGPDNGLLQAITDTRNMVVTKDGETFAAEWGSSTGGKQIGDKPTFSRITLFDAIGMADKGSNAKEILEKAFPGSTITLIENIKK